jgi:predicted nucleotidyltransferase
MNPDLDVRVAGRPARTGHGVHTEGDPGTGPLLESLRTLVVDAVAPWGARVWLFGSRARGDARPGSDVDIAIEPRSRKVPPQVLAELVQQIEESVLPWNVDLVDLAEVDETFRRRVRAEAVAWND